jgi:hypothetical protein
MEPSDGGLVKGLRAGTVECEHALVTTQRSGTHARTAFAAFHDLSLLAMALALPKVDE